MTILIQRKSELISSVSELICADLFHVLWISAEKRQISGTAMLSADYCCDFNSGGTTRKREIAVMERMDKLHSLYFLCLSQKSQQCYNAVVKTLKIQACLMPELCIFYTFWLKRRMFIGNRVMFSFLFFPKFAFCDVIRECSVEAKTIKSDLFETFGR